MVSSPVAAPLPVSTALVVTVVPWTIRSSRARNSASSSSSSAAISRSPLSSPREGSSGVLGDLCAQ